MTRYKLYNLEDAEKIVGILSDHGVNARIIGHLPSNHDIDILTDAKTIPDSDPIQWLSNILDAKYVICTELESYLFLSKKYGHVEIFYENPEFYSLAFKMRKISNYLWKRLIKNILKKDLKVNFF